MFGTSDDFLQSLDWHGPFGMGYTNVRIVFFTPGSLMVSDHSLFFKFLFLYRDLETLYVQFLHVLISGKEHPDFRDIVKDH